MDDFVNKIFKNKVFVEAKMQKFGFKKIGDSFVYTKKLLDNQFEFYIKISGTKNIETRLTDIQTKDIYTLHLLEGAAGTFVGEVREAYRNILDKIAENCCKSTYFIFPQSNRLTDLIKEKYGDSPEFLWEKFSGTGIFRNPQTRKWYAAILNIDKSKIDKKSKGEVEVLNIKLDKEEVQNLLKQKGFYPAYHMNKKSWITIILDETFDDKTIMHLIKKSHIVSGGNAKTVKSEWIVPANPKYFNLDRAFAKNKEILWKQSNNIQAGDIVYLYVAAPVKAIRYKCEVLKSDIPYKYEDTNLKINRVMKIKMTEKYNDEVLSFKVLNKYGIKSVRGPRNMPLTLSRLLK